jgi:hypothetical protein
MEQQEWWYGHFHELFIGLRLCHTSLSTDCLLLFSDEATASNSCGVSTRVVNSAAAVHDCDNCKSDPKSLSNPIWAVAKPVSKTSMAVPL